MNEAGKMRAKTNQHWLNCNRLKIKTFLKAACHWLGMCVAFATAQAIAAPVNKEDSLESLVNQLSLSIDWWWFGFVGLLVILVLIFSLSYRLINHKFKRLNAQLEQSKAKLSEAQRIARMGSWSRDFETGETHWSEEALKVFDSDDADQLRHYEALVHPDDLEKVIEVIAETYHRGGNYECEHRIISPAGAEKHIRLAGKVFLDDDNCGPVHELGTVQDITERKKAEESVRQSEGKLRSILESAPYPIMIFDAQKEKVLYANQSTYLMFEFAMDKSLSEISDMDSFWVQDEDREKLLAMIADEGDIRNHEILMKTANGKRFWALLSASVMDFGGENAVFVSLLDVTEKKLIQEELERLATTDPLTGILNRRSFFDMANKELRRSSRYNNIFSLLMFDIDHFKRVNDTYGHAFGDEVIRRFAEVCNECLREEDIFGRIGGEEFSIILVAANVDGAIIVAERIRKKWNETEFAVDSKEISFSVSVGVSILQDPNESIDIIMERADKALYEAKEAGRNCVKLSEMSGDAA